MPISFSKNQAILLFSVYTFANILSISSCYFLQSLLSTSRYNNRGVKRYNYEMTATDKSPSSKEPMDVDCFNKLPSLVVFDLDMCLWSTEMYTLHEIPTEKSKTLSKRVSDDDAREIITAVSSDGEFIRLFPAALKVLQDFYLDKLLLLLLLNIIILSLYYYI